MTGATLYHFCTRYVFREAGKRTPEFIFASDELILLNAIMCFSVSLKVCAGPCLESFGIQVAEMANCPTSVIMNAKRKAKKMENFDYRKKKMATIQSHEQKVEDMKLAENFMSLPLNSYQTTEEKWNAINKLLH